MQLHAPLPSPYAFLYGSVFACRNADTLKRLQDTEKLQKEQTEAAYVSLDISNEEKEKGNQVSCMDYSSLLCECLCDQPYWRYQSGGKKTPGLAVFLWCVRSL